MGGMSCTADHRVLWNSMCRVEIFKGSFNAEHMYGIWDKRGDCFNQSCFPTGWSGLVLPAGIVFETACLLGLVYIGNNLYEDMGPGANLKSSLCMIIRSCFTWTFNQWQETGGQWSLKMSEGAQLQRYACCQRRWPRKSYCVWPSSEGFVTGLYKQYRSLGGMCPGCHFRRVVTKSVDWELLPWRGE